MRRRQRVRPRRGLARGLCAATLALTGALLAAYALRLRLNLSPSLPLGLYRKVEEPIARRSLVLACPPEPAARLALLRGYLPAGACPGGTAPLGKIVLALEGDEIDLRGDGIAVNGRPVPRSRLATLDSRGRPLPRQVRRPARLRRGEIFLFSPFDDRSFDSRYFGPVPQEAVLGVIAPVLIRDAVAPAGFRLEPFRSHST
jgi:conjugative transfer signal peptidase TraF